MPPGRVAPPYSRACAGYVRGKEAALASRKKQVVFWGCCCHSVVLSSDYMQASAVKPVHTAHDWLSEHPGFRCVCQCRTHSKLVRPQLQRARQPVVCPYAGELAECSLCDGHTMTNVSVVSTVTLQSRPQILERVYVLERSVADVHLAQQSLSSTPLCSLHSSIGHVHVFINMSYKHGPSSSDKGPQRVSGRPGPS